MYPILTKGLLLVLWLPLFASGVAYAEEPTTPDFTVKPLDLGNFITIIVVLILIIGLIILLIRFLASKNNSWFSSRPIRNIGGVTVGQNKSVQILKIGNAVYILGVGEEVRLLDKVEAQEEIEVILQSLNQTPALSGRGIISYFKNGLMGRKQKDISNEPEQSELSSFQEIFHNKMQQVSNRRQRLRDALDKDENTDGNSS